MDLKNPARVYVIVDEKLSAGSKMAQGGHAIAEFFTHFPDTANAWTTHGNVIVILEAPSDRLYEITGDLVANGEPVGYFCEPDFNNKLTAMAGYGTPGVQTAAHDLPLSRAMGRTGESRARSREAKMRATVWDPTPTYPHNPWG